MITEVQIKEIITKGIVRYSQHYKQPAENIQIAFKMNAGKLDFITCINEKPTNTIGLIDLIGRNIYNWIVENHLKGLLKKFSTENKVSDDDVIVMCGSKVKEEVYIQLRQTNGTILREITDPQELK